MRPEENLRIRAAGAAARWPAKPPYQPIAFLPGYTYCGQTEEVEVYAATALGPRAVQLGQHLVASGRLAAGYGRLAFMFSKATTVRPPMSLLIQEVGLGAYHIGFGSEVYASCTADFDPDTLLAVFLCEACEIFALWSRRDWTSTWSHGEALSRVAGDFLVPGKLAPYHTVHYWLNDAPRADWVTRSMVSETNGPAIASGVCAINYLRHELGISFPDLTATAGTSLEEKYTRLTGRHGLFAAMMALVDRHYPPGEPVPASTPDNLFPLA